jgi:site-specific recombinase XerD
MPRTGTANTAAIVSDIDRLASSWRLDLTAERKSPKTIDTYMEGVTQLGVFLAERSMPTNVAHITREHVESFIVHLLGTPSPATAHKCYRAVHQYLFMLDAGGRLSEVANLQITDIDLSDGLARVVGKGRRERALPMGPTTAKADTVWPMSN